MGYVSFTLTGVLLFFFYYFSVDKRDYSDAPGKAGDSIRRVIYLTTNYIPDISMLYRVVSNIFIQVLWKVEVT